MMRIVLVSEIFAPGMGYLENILPKYLARQGAEVDVVASSLPSDYRRWALPTTHSGRGAEITSETADGFRLHVLGHTRTLGHVRLVGLSAKLRELGPDIVQTMTPIGWIALAAAWNRQRLGYRLFSGCHYHASVFPLAGKEPTIFHPAVWQSHIERFLPGRLASWATEKYYAIAPDCAAVAKRFFGVPGEKIEVCPLGVDTEIFYPASRPDTWVERTVLRLRLGFRDNEIVCVYSGRFGEDKNPLLLARAVARLAGAGEAFRGLFVGTGEQAEAIAACRGCISQPSMPMANLGAFYRAADIGVWPAQESMSMLDALACGLPLVANDTMQAPERLRGTGLAYRLGDVDDLVVQLLALRNPQVREKLGAEGARRMREEFSWEAIARSRLRDYSAVLAHPTFDRSRTLAGARADAQFTAENRSGFSRRKTEESESPCP
jgi:glycosyltransferase involved in cell wall biosynthesis